MTASFQTLQIKQLHFSTTTAQVERRAHFDKQGLTELAESIKATGLLQPPVARPVNGHFEIVAGERRVLAAKQAGLAEISVSVRELTDEQVLELAKDLNDVENIEIGPMDRRELRQVVIELLELRKAKKPVVTPASALAELRL